MQNLEVNYNIDKVYEAFINGVNTVSSFKLKSASKENYSINISVRMSMFSWGENLTVSLTKLEDNKTEIMFIS